MANPPSIPQDDRFYQSSTLMKAFGISSLLMMVCTLWMILDDFGKEWKGVQKEFFVLRQKKYDQWIQEAQEKIDEGKLKEARASLDAAERSVQNQSFLQEKLRNEVEPLKTLEKLATVRYQDEKQIWDVEKYKYEAKYGHKVAEGHVEGTDSTQALEKLNAHWEKVLALRNKMNELTEKREQKERDIATLLSEKQLAEKNLKSVRGELDRLESQKKASELTLEKLLRSAPIIDLANPTFRLQQVVLDDIRDDIFFANVRRVDRCTTCHLAIDTPGFENEVNPFKTHPRLDLVLSGGSPHPIDKVGCTVCHEGRGQATDFVRSAHMPRNEEQKKDWEKRYGWHETEHVIEKMIPLQFVEGKCRVCHKATEYVPKAEKLNQSTQLIRAAGCYGCHRIEGWDHLRKPAPSLERVKGKLSRDWIVKWLKNPKDFNEYARMPSPFYQSNIQTEEHKQFQEAEIHAISDFLLEISQPYEPNVQLPLGNSERGKTLVKTVGCLGCHQIDDFGRSRGRWTQAPDLSTVGSKVGRGWLSAWLRNPRHYWQETTMPSFRLTDSEISDVAAYLLSKRNLTFEQYLTTLPVPETQKQLLKIYLLRDPKLAPATTEKVEGVLSKMSEHEVSLNLGERAVQRYGCYGCHTIRGFEKAQGIGAELTEEGSKPVNKLDFGLLHLEHSNVAWFEKKLENTRVFDSGMVKDYLDLLRMPQYGFDPEERELIITSLLGWTSQKIGLSVIKKLNAAESLAEEGHRLIHKYNCQGCHVVEGLFSSLPSEHPGYEGHEKLKYKLEGRILEHYSEDETLGPPPLITEGQRVKTDWLYGFLEDPGKQKLRHKLNVRMPTFQMRHEGLNTLVKGWAEGAQVEFPILQPTEAHLSASEMQVAKKMFDALQCINCHTVGRKPTPEELEAEGGSKGLAPDLALASKRLHKQWVRNLLKDPAKMIPGTRMPGFWPEGSSPFPDILGGNSDEQMRVLTEYVMGLGR